MANLFLRLKNSNSKGFTLVEVLLVVALVTIISGIAIPVTNDVYTRNSLELAKISWVDNLRQAQTMARLGKDDSLWGAHLGNNQITLFKGENFLGRDPSFDEVIEINSNINYAGLTEVVFAKFTGEPQVAGTTTLTLGNDVRSINLNQKGNVDF